MTIDVPSNEWFETATEILSLAAQGTTRSEFERAAKFSHYQVGRSTDYQMVVLNRLIREGIVLQIGASLRLGSLDALTWLDDFLCDGHQASWNFARAYEELSGREKKFDASRLAQIGLSGENFVVEQLRAQLPTELKSSVTHVSLLNDAAGYDIEAPSVTIDGAVRFLEVKTSERFFGDSFRVYLTKNEFLRGCEDPRWSIVGVAKINGTHELLGFVQAHQIESMLPRNINPRASWEVVMLYIENEMWQRGLP